jgi:hypothetical protein
MRSKRLQLRGRMVATKISRVVSSSGNALLLATIVAVLLIIVGAGVLSAQASRETKGLAPLLQDQAIGALSVALVALVAWLGFRLRFRDAKTRYLRSYWAVSTTQAGPTSSAEQAAVRAAVDELVALRPPTLTPGHQRSGQPLPGA